LGEIDNFMGIFDTTERFTVSLSTKIGPNDSFHVNRPFIEATPPPSFHDHDFFECFWIASGWCTHYINGATERVETGTMMFIRPPDWHAFQNADGPPCQMVNVAFSAETAAHLRDRYASDLEGRFFWTNDRRPASYLLDSAQMRDLSVLEQGLDRGTRSLARIESFLLTLMADFLATTPDTPAEAPDWLVRAFEAFADPAALRGGVPALVDLTGRSHEHVSRTFRRLFGQTPSAYVNALRMNLAARQLAGSDTPIMEVALDCGVEDLSHFYRLFRETHGTSPMRYRRRARVDLVHPQRAAAFAT
jgi:AraC family transcriptional regulator, dual regulator of chb operon